MRLIARILMGALALAGWQARADEKISLDAVPRHVKDAALAAVPGLVLERAEREVEKGVVIYDLEGKASGVRYEVEVTAAGKVTEIEKEDDESEGDDRDDDGKDD
jgi:hypothetical protein